MDTLGSVSSYYKKYPSPLRERGKVKGEN